jgi:hypothetical protein
MKIVPILKVEQITQGFCLSFKKRTYGICPRWSIQPFGCVRRGRVVVWRSGCGRGSGKPNSIFVWVSNAVFFAVFGSRLLFLICLWAGLWSCRIFTVACEFSTPSPPSNNQCSNRVSNNPRSHYRSHYRYYFLQPCPPNANFTAVILLKNV